MANAGQAKFDPRATERKGITPGFSNQNGKSDRTPITGSEKDSTNSPTPQDGAAGRDKGEAARSAEQNFADAEQNAVNEGINDSDGVDEIGGDEVSPAQAFISKVGGATILGRAATKRLKGKGPVATVLILLITVGGLMISAQSMMPFSLLEQLKDKFNGIEISNNLRTKAIFKAQLARKQIKNPTKSHVFGSDTYKLTNNQQRKLAAEGIEMKEVEVDGKKKNVLLFDDGSGARKLVVADDSDVSLMKKLGTGKTKININGEDFDVDLDDIQTFQHRFNTDPDFRNGYTKQSRTWAGSVGAWFDTHTANFLNRFALTRKIFANFIQRVEDENAGNTRSRVAEAIEQSSPQRLNVDTEEATFNAYQEDVETDSKGNPVKDKDGNIKTKISNDGDYKQFNPETDISPNVNKTNQGKKVTRKSFSIDRTKPKAQQIAEVKNLVKESVTGRVSSAANSIANTSCIALTVVGSALLIANGQQTFEVLKAGNMFLEATDKKRAGDGAYAPAVENLLMEKADTVIYEDDVPKIVSTEPLSAMQASSMGALYTGQRQNTQDPSVRQFTLGDIFDGLFGQLSLSAASFRACTIAKMSTAVLGATLDLVGAIVCTVTVGLGCLAKYGAEAAFGVATGLATSKLVEVILGVVTPKLAGIFANDLLVDLVGEHLGNAIVAGSARYMLTNYRVGGGSLATLTKYLAYRTEQEKVLAEKAQYERETRSPFDATSQHTFLGSIIKQVITLSTMSSSPLNIISGLSTITGNSILALIPSASAANDVGQDLIPEEEFEEACPHLASIGAYGDAFCNPYIITDTSTMEILPDEIEGNPVIQESLEDGNIKTDSGLAKYILYCGNRTSDFGIMDTSIASEIGDSAFLNSSNNIVNGVVGGVPVAGDAADFFTNQKQLANAAWISGEACVADDNSEYDWDTTKIYQRYVEDERYKESAEPGYKTKVTSFLEEYYKNNPLDNSYEGILARYSGLSKETVVATLDYIDYIKYVAQYKPEERYAFGDALIQKVQKIIFKGESDEKVSALLQHEIVYADTRNRAFIVA